MDGFGLFLFALFMALVIAAYFAPAIVAWSRGHHNAGAIFTLNLLLGWSVIGWAIAMVWAVSNPPRVAVR